MFRWNLVFLLAALPLCTLAFGADNTTAAPRYTVTDLGTLPGGGGSDGLAVNGAGHVLVNFGKNGIGPTYLGVDGQWTRLANMNASAINNHDQVIADGLGDFLVATLWENGKVHALTKGSDTSASIANGINSQGWVVGNEHQLGSPTRAYLWSNGKAHALPQPHGSLGSEAEAINDAGMIVGYVETSQKVSEFLHVEHAAVWDNGTVQDLGTLGGAYCELVAVNNKGQALGYRVPEPGTAGIVGGEWFLWQAGHVTFLKGIHTGLNVEALNDAGTVVGYGDSGDAPAAMWQDGHVVDLNTLIPADSGWKLQMANGINNRGQIIGYGTWQGKQHAFLLTPVADGSGK